MAKKWTEVIASPEFQQLSAEDRNLAKQQYFNDVVVPQVAGHEVEAARQQFNTQFPDYTTGAGAALGSSVRRLGAGVEEVLGFSEEARQDYAQSQQYVPTLRSYRDISSVGDLVSYVSENTAQAAPYLGGLAAEVVAAPFTGGASLAVGGAVDAAIATAEAGATHIEQGSDADWGRAVGTAVLEQGLMRVIPMAGPEGQTLVRQAGGFVGREATRSGAQHLIHESVGMGKTFDESMANIDEAMVGGVMQMAPIAAARRAASVAPRAAIARSEATRQARAEDIISMKQGAHMATQMRGQAQRELNAANVMDKLFDNGETVNKEVMRTRLQERIGRGPEQDVTVNNLMNRFGDNITKQEYEGVRNSLFDETRKHSEDVANFSTMDAIDRLNEGGAKLTGENLNVSEGVMGALGVTKGEQLTSTLGRLIQENVQIPLVGDFVKFGSAKEYARQNDSAYSNVKTDFNNRLEDTKSAIQNEIDSGTLSPLQRKAATRNLKDLNELRSGIEEYINTGTPMSDSANKRLTQLDLNLGRRHWQGDSLIHEIEVMRNAKNIVDRTSGKGGQDLTARLTGIGLSYFAPAAAAGAALASGVGRTASKVTQTKVAKGISDARSLLETGELPEVDRAKLESVLSALEESQATIDMGRPIGETEEDREEESLLQLMVR